MKNKKVCETRSNGFLLDIGLFSDSNNNSQFDYLGSVVQISKPLARQLIKELKVSDHREIIVPVLEKEYQMKISVDRLQDRYRIMDNERSRTLGYLDSQTLEKFVGD